MEFGEIELALATGAILAHSVRRANVNFKKGRVLSAADVEALRADAVETVVAARLGPDDVHEDAAAAELGRALKSDNLRAKAPFTGRVNLFAESSGALHYDTAALSRMNRVHESITVAALPPWTRVQPRQMVATVKIIPLATPKTALAEAVTRLMVDGEHRQLMGIESCSKSRQYDFEHYLSSLEAVYNELAT